MDGRVLKRGDLLAASIALSRWIKKHCAGERVAVVLPPGVGAVVANVAVTLANKVAVNLNFTAGRAALQSAINRGQILHAISAKPVMKRLEDFPWPKDVFRLEELMPELKPKIVIWRLISAVTPAWVLSHLLGLPRRGDRKEAVLLFTSGSLRRTERCRAQPSERAGKCPAVWLDAQSWTGRFGDGFSSILSQFRLHRHLVVSDDRRGARCYLPYPGRCGKKRRDHRALQDLVAGDDSDIFARISEAD